MTGRGRLLVVALVVFALAAGVLVGSGPLRHALRADGEAADLAQAQQDAAAARAEADVGRAFAESAGAAALRNRLDGHAVALVGTPDATDDDLAAATARIAATGATLAATVSLTEVWTADDRGPFREALADQITAALDVPFEGATPSQVLSAALAQALSAGGEYDAAGQDRADAMWSLLVEASLVSGDRGGPADMVVLVTPGGGVGDLSEAFADASLATVVAVTGPRVDESVNVSTVTDASSFYGAWAVAAALVGAAGGSTGSYDAADAPDIVASLG